MKSILILLIAALAVQAAIVDYEDMKTFETIDPNTRIQPTNFDQEPELASTSTITEIKEEIAPQPADVPQENSSAPVDGTNEMNQSNKHEMKGRWGDRKHEGKPFRNHENRPEWTEEEKKNHERKFAEGQGKPGFGRPEGKKPCNGKKDKNAVQQGQQQHDNKADNLRGQESLQQSTSNSPADIHSNFKRGGSKLKKAFKKLPKGVRIASIVLSSLLGLFILVKIVKCCRRRRQERKARREALRQEYLSQQATQQFLNNSNNNAESFLPSNLQGGVAIGQPIPQQVAAPANASQQQLNYSYPPLTNTLLTQQQQYLQLQQQQQLLLHQQQQLQLQQQQEQQQQQRVAVPVNVQQLPQQYYALANQVPQGQGVQILKPVHPVLVNAQGFMTVEAPQLSINQSNSINNTERASFEIAEPVNVNGRRQQYPVLHQQQLKNPFGYQQF